MKSSEYLTPSYPPDFFKYAATAAALCFSVSFVSLYAFSGTTNVTNWLQPPRVYHLDGIRGKYLEYLRQNVAIPQMRSACT